jgi:hypothetical protein
MGGHRYEDGDPSLGKNMRLYLKNNCDEAKA